MDRATLRGLVPTPRLGRLVHPRPESALPTEPGGSRWMSAAHPRPPEVHLVAYTRTHRGHPPQTHRIRAALRLAAFLVVTCVVTGATAWSVLTFALRSLLHPIPTR